MMVFSFIPKFCSHRFDRQIPIESCNQIIQMALQFRSPGYIGGVLGFLSALNLYNLLAIITATGRADMMCLFYAMTLRTGFGRGQRHREVASPFTLTRLSISFLGLTSHFLISLPSYELDLLTIES